MVRVWDGENYPPRDYFGRLHEACQILPPEDRKEMKKIYVVGISFPFDRRPLVCGSLNFTLEEGHFIQPFDDMLGARQAIKAKSLKDVQIYELVPVKPRRRKK